MADMEGAIKLPEINFAKGFFSDIVKNVTNELKANKSQTQSSPTNKASKHDTRNNKIVQQPTWDADMIGVMVTCITKALTPIIVQTVQAAITSLIPSQSQNSVPPAQVNENLNLNLSSHCVVIYMQITLCCINVICEIRIKLPEMLPDVQEHSYQWDSPQYLNSQNFHSSSYSSYYKFLSFHISAC